jgi:hypothetical protein
MNNDFDNLMYEAGLTAQGCWDKMDDYDHAAIMKFAELIVQECVKVVDAMADPEDSERYFWAIQNASTKIKQHFGVEE